MQYFPFNMPKDIYLYVRVCARARVCVCNVFLKVEHIKPVTVITIILSIIAIQ